MVICAKAALSHRAVDCAFATSADSGATCDSFASSWGPSVDDLKKLNPGIVCPSFDTSKLYCVIGTTSTTTTAPSNIPTMPGLAANCDGFYKVSSVDQCDTIAAKHGISTAQFRSWNSEINAGRNIPHCTNLWLDYYVCVHASGATTTSQPTVPPSTGATPTPIQPGMVTNCNKFHNIRPTTTCQEVLEYNRISLADFVKWNPAVGVDCGSLWADTYACVGVVGGGSQTLTKTTPTTTTPGNGITTPTPTQAGMVTNCNKFHHVSPTTTCEGILNYNKIRLADFFKWNPAVKEDCTGLWSDTYACVGVE